MPSITPSRYTNAEAQTTVKANVKLNELQPPDAAIDINAQKIEDVGAPDSDDDAPRRDTIDTKINTHEAAATGIHGVGASTIDSVANRNTAIATRMPSGIIIMWHGTIATIPTGWVICDGNNSTPNLLTRFLQGVATAGTNPGATGGATAKTTAGHTHTGPSHTHTNPNTGVPSDSLLVNAGPDTERATENHTHAQGSTGASGTGATSSRTDSIADIRPKFYDVAFLMKT